MNKKQNTFRLWLSTFVAATLFGVMASTANAAVLYSQPTSDGADAFFSNLGAGAQNADSFLLGGPVNVEALRWWGSYRSTNVDDFVVRLFSDNSGVPGALLQEYAGLTVSKDGSGLMDSRGGEVFQYEYDLPDFVLSSGKYYLSVMNETLNSEWLWSVGGSGDGVSFFRGADGDAWDVADSDLAFAVIGTRQVHPVPEPESAALVMLAGVCMLLARRRSPPPPEHTN